MKEWVSGGACVPDPDLGKVLGMLASSPVPVALHDADGCLRYANPAYREGHAIAPDEVVTWEEAMRRAHRLGTGLRIREADFEQWLANARASRGKTPFRAFEAGMADGRWLWIIEQLDGNGWVFTAAVDITAVPRDDDDARLLRFDLDIARRVARTDDLTGALNRRGILGVLEDLSGRRQAEGRGFALCMADLDDFKRINDSHGHDAGDRVLRAFVGHALTCIRDSDHLGRYGGDEFLMVFPDIDSAGAGAIMDRLRSTLPGVRVADVGQALRYSFSAGVLGVTGQHPVRELLRRVDQALYEAKDKGRGRTVIATME